MAAGRKTENVLQVEAFLAEFVTPHLRAAGYRKSSHTFRRQLTNGDEAGLQFRAYSIDRLGSFLMDVWVCVEPVWDLERFDPDRAHPYPKRTQTYDASWSHRQIRPSDEEVRALLTGDQIISFQNWEWTSVAERDQSGRLMRDLLISKLIPRFARMLDRPALLDLARAGDNFGLPWHTPRVYRALLVDAGPSEELDSILLAADPTNDKDTRFSAWAAARLLDGPTWRALTTSETTEPRRLDP